MPHSGAGSASTAGGVSPTEAVRETDTTGAAGRTRGIPTFKDNPIGAIGLVLSNVAAGARGQELPTTKIRKEQLANRELQLRQFTVTMKAIDQGLKTFSGADPSDPKTAQAIDAYVARFSQTLPGLGEGLDVALEMIKQRGAQFLEGIGEHTTRLFDHCGYDVTCLQNTWADPKIRETWNQTADNERFQGIVEKFKLMADSVGGNEKLKELFEDGKWSVADLRQLPEGFKFTEDELTTIGRNKEIQAGLLEFNFQPPGVALKGAEARVTEARPELIKLQEKLAATDDPKQKAEIQKRIDKLGAIVGTTEFDVQLGKPAQTQLEKTAIATSEGLARLTRIQQDFRPEFLEIGTRLSAAFTAGLEKLGFEVSRVDKQALEDFAVFKKNAAENINLYIKEITGAQMSEPEAKRLKRAVPDPGAGIFDGDAPTVFKAKLDDAIETLKLANARALHARRLGLNFLDINLSQMPEIIKRRRGQIVSGLRQANPGIDESTLDNQADRDILQEFGIEPEPKNIIDNLLKQIESQVGLR